MLRHGSNEIFDLRPPAKSSEALGERVATWQQHSQQQQQQREQQEQQQQREQQEQQQQQEREQQQKQRREPPWGRLPQRHSSPNLLSTRKNTF